MEPGIATTSVRVRYAETDQMGIVHHGTYLVWFEVGRTHLLESRGMSMTEVESNGVFLAVTHLAARLVSPARHGETIHIDTWVDRRLSRQIRFRYRARRDQTVLATGDTDLICLDQDFHPIRWPAWLVDALGEPVGASPDLRLP